MREKADFLRRLSADPAAFRDALRIETAGDLTPLGKCLDPWQRDDFSAMDPAWRRIAGHNVDVPFTRAWIERPRGHSKSQDVAVSALWALAFSPRPIMGVAAAADRDQAAIVRQAVERLVRNNPWLGEVITINQWRVVNTRTGSELSILASDTASSWGLLIDFLIADEVSIWPHDQFWIAMLSAIAKKPNALLVAILNAGFTESWAWPVRQQIRDDASWYFNAVPGPVASWISATQLDEQKRLLPVPAFNRLWQNQWVRGAGDALPIEEIERAIIPTIGPLNRPEPDTVYIGGVDLSRSRDRRAVVVLGANGRTQRIRLAACQSWRPDAFTGKIDLISVKHYIWQIGKQLGVAGFLCDPYEASLLGQELHVEGLNMLDVPFSGKNLNEMAICLVQAFRQGVVELYPHAELVDDLGRLSIVEREYGCKLTAARTAGGHADLAVAFSLALPPALEMATTGYIPIAAQEEWAKHDPWGGRRIVTSDELLLWRDQQERQHNNHMQRVAALYR